MGTQTKKTNKYMSLAAVTLAFSFTFLSRYIWSPLMADVSGEFGINATQAGLYMSAFFAGYLVTQIPGGIMADKYQPKYILIACTVLGGAMTALMSAINSYEMGLAIRVVTGVSSGCVMAQCSKVVLTFAPKRALGVVLASLPFGITLAQSLGALSTRLLMADYLYDRRRSSSCYRGFISYLYSPLKRKCRKLPPPRQQHRPQQPKLPEPDRPECWRDWLVSLPINNSFFWAPADLCSCLSA
ncbi:MAG: MFS transporter [Clostridium sp.]